MNSMAPSLKLLQSKLGIFSKFYDSIKSGSISMESAISEMLSVSNAEEFSGYARQHWEQSKSLMSSKLHEMRERVIVMIQDTGVDEVTAGSAQLAEQLSSKDILKDGQEQIEKMMAQVYSAEWMGTDGSNPFGVNEVDLSAALSDVYAMGKNDPTLDGLSVAFESSFANFKNSLHDAHEVFLASKSGQILGEGSEKLKQRMENLLGSLTRDSSSNSGATPSEKTSLLPSLVDALGRKMASPQGRSAIDKIKGSILGTVAKINFVGDEGDDSLIARWGEMLFAQAEERMFTSVLGNSFIRRMLHMLIDGSQSMSREQFIAEVEERVCEVIVAAVIALKSGEVPFDPSFPSGLDIKRLFENAIKGNLSSTKHKLNLLRLRGKVVSTLSNASESAGLPVPESLSSIRELSTSAGLGLELPNSLEDIADLFAKLASGGGSGGTALSMQGAMAELMKSSLDSDSSEQAAKRLLEVGDKMVDSIESIRGLDSVQKVIGQISSFDAHSTLLSTIESVDTDNALAMAESAISDSAARLRLVETIKTHVIDFLSQYLPTLSIPALSGVSDDVEYSISGLDMSGFKLNKEGIHVTFSDDISKSDLISFTASGINARFVGVSWSYAQLFFPHLSGSGVADATVENASIEISFRVVRVPKGAAQILSSMQSMAQKIKALSEKFPGLGAYINRVRDWLLEGDPTYEPGTVSLQAVLSTPVNKATAQRLWGKPAEIEEWEPVLVISRKKLSIENLQLVTENNSFAWLYNMLAGVFSSIIKDYVCAQLESSIVDKGAQLLGMVNGLVGEHWPMIRRFIQLPVDGLPISSGAELFILCANTADDPSAGAGKVSRDYVLKFTEEGSIGLKVDILRKGGPGTQTMDRLQVLGYVPQSQAERVLAEQRLDNPGIRNALIRSVNSKSLVGLSADEGLQELRGPRPLYVGIRLSEEGFKYLQASRSRKRAERKRRLVALGVTFGEGSLGLKLKETKSCGGAVIISGFAKGPEGETLQAESKGCLSPGMIMLAVEETVIFGKSFAEVMEVLKAAPRPVKVVFTASPDLQVAFATFPHELVMHKVEALVMVSSTFQYSAPSPAAVAAAAADSPASPSSSSSSSGSSSSSSESGYSDGSIEIKPGTAVIQVNRTLIAPEFTVRNVVDLIREQLPTTKVAFRDMDAFMHLIRIRDGSESLSADVDLRSGDPGDQGQGPVEERALDA